MCVVFLGILGSEGVEGMDGYLLCMGKIVVACREDRWLLASRVRHVFSPGIGLLTRGSWGGRLLGRLLRCMIADGYWGWIDASSYLNFGEFLIGSYTDRTIYSRLRKGNDFFSSMSGDISLVPYGQKLMAFCI